MITGYKSVVEWAAAQGSTAKTTAGARKFLSKARCLSPGLRRLDNPAPHTYTHGSRAAYQDAARLAREMRRAESIVAANGWPALEDQAKELKSILTSTWPYRRAESRWAGGKHTVNADIGFLPSARCDNSLVWSSNGKWSGNNSCGHITVTYRAVNLLGVEGLIIGGLLTLDAELVAPRAVRAVWVEQGRGVALKLVEGWIVRGYHVAGGTLEAANKKAAGARKRAVHAALATRADRRNTIKENFKSVWVTIEDSLAAGNCGPASEQVQTVVRRFVGGNISAVRADVLLRIVPAPLLPRALRAIQTAAARLQKTA
jgi:Tfp pilus assembly major pilin PilA